MAAAMQKTTRIRLILNHYQQESTRKCWFMVDHLHTPTIESLIHAMKSRFSISTSSKIDFFLDDFEIPTFESTDVLRDNDIVRVQVRTGRREDSQNSDDRILCDSFTQCGAVSAKGQDIVSSSTEGKKKKQKIEYEFESSSSKASNDKGKKKKKPTRTERTHQADSLEPQDVSLEPQTSRVKKKKKKSPRKRKSTSAEEVDEGGEGRPGIENLKVPTPKKLRKAKKDTKASESSTSSTSSDEEIVTKKKSGKPTVNEEAERKLKDFVDNLPEVKRQRRGGRTRKRKSTRRVETGGQDTSLKTYIQESPAISSVIYQSAIHSMTAEKEPSENQESGSAAPLELEEAGNDDFVVHQASDLPNNRQGRENNKQKKKKGRRNGVVNAPELNDLLGQQETIKIDYSSYPLLQGTPRTGDRIAFKIIEMSANYEPVLSDYKLADVLNVDGGNAELKFADGQDIERNGKFDLGEDYAEAPPETTWYEICTLSDVRSVAIVPGKTGELVKETTTEELLLLQTGELLPQQTGEPANMTTESDKMESQTT